MPAAPGKPKHERLDRKTMKITWSSPESDGGSPITGYVVEMCKNRSEWVIVNEGEVSPLCQPTFKPKLIAEIIIF